MEKEKLKQFLEIKLKDCEDKIRRKKKKRKIVKIIYGSTIILSITASTAIVAVSGSFVLPLLPPLTITALSSISAISAAISSKFKLKNKTAELNGMISRLEKIKQRIDYVIACNGTLTDVECENIMNEFL